jgi:hypothetical protein
MLGHILDAAHPETLVCPQQIADSEHQKFMHCDLHGASFPPYCYGHSYKSHAKMPIVDFH